MFKYPQGIILSMLDQTLPKQDSANTNSRTYIAIDLKSFYASVECVDRGLDPLTTKLVVADITRTDKTVCLAVSPALKALGVGGRDRLFQVYKKVPRDSFIIAPPRMQKYVDVSTSIFGIYAEYLAPTDIHIYSIDEAFLDVTSYLQTYQMTAHQLARTIVKDVLGHTGITATVGIGENLYLAKVAMDIVAKHLPPDLDGVRIAELTEYSYREKLWTHTPLTDFWRIGPGYSRRLQNLGIYTMGDLARYSLTASAKLFKAFGVNAELLIDHAWGYEPTTISDIKNYQAANHCLCSGQVLHRPYNRTETITIIKEMAYSLALDLTQKNLLTDQIILDLGFSGPSRSSFAHASKNLPQNTSSAKIISQAALEIYQKIMPNHATVRRVGITANHILSSQNDTAKTTQLNLFDSPAKTEQETEQALRLQKATLDIQTRYGKNALMLGMNFRPEATMRERNQQIGGHRAG